METNRSRFTVLNGASTVPAKQGTPNDPDLRHSGYLPDDAREQEDELLQKGYLIGRTLDVERQLRGKINREKRGLYFDAIETYAGLVDDTVDLKDSIENAEKQELVVGFAQTVLTEGSAGFMRNLRTAEAKINRVAEIDLSVGLKLTATKPKEKTIERRKLSWGERLRGETYIQYE